MTEKMRDSNLRAFLQAANESERESLAEYQDFIDFLDRIDALFRRLLNGEVSGEPLTWMLFLNAHASFLAAVRIALSGQVPPTHMALRGALESGLFSLIASRSEENRTAWLNRDKDRRRSKSIYTAPNAMKLLENDPNLLRSVREAYELAIDFGAHPNRRSLIDHLSFDEVTDDGYPVSLTYLHGAPSTQSLRAIAACIEVGLTILFISPHALSIDRAGEAHSEAAQIRQEFDRFIREEGYYSDDE
jgi:hypothetical protein